MTPVAFPQSETQLRQWLRRFPAADTDGNGTLTVEENQGVHGVPQTGQERTGPAYRVPCGSRLEQGPFPG
jgi:hypothetical protein